MPDLNLDQARADIATVAATDGRVYGIDQLDEVYAAQAAQGRIVDRHAPALMAAVDRVRAMCAFLTDRPEYGDSAASLVLAALENRAPEEAGGA